MRLAIGFAGIVGFAAFATAAAAGCGAGSPLPVKPVPSAAANATAARVAADVPDAGPPVAPPEEQGPCKVLAAERKAELDRVKAVSESKDPLGRADAVSDEIRGAFVHCTKTKAGGAWGLALRDVKSERNGITGVALAEHVDASGNKTELRLKGPNRLAERSFAATDIDRVTIASELVFDYDGDGQDEYVVVGSNQTKEGVKDLLTWVLTVKGGAVELYAPAKNVVASRVEDVDRDERPDLVSYGPYRTRVAARCSNEPTIAVGPSLLVHSQKDGSFSWTAAAAIAFAKRSCPKGGFEIARDEEKKVDDEQTFENVACARMWGVSEAQVSGVVSSQCRPVSGEAACKEAALKSCGQTQSLLTFAHFAPPLRLK